MEPPIAAKAPCGIPKVPRTEGRGPNMHYLLAFGRDRVGDVGQLQAVDAGEGGQNDRTHSREYRAVRARRPSASTGPVALGSPLGDTRRHEGLGDPFTHAPFHARRSRAAASRAIS